MKRENGFTLGIAAVLAFLISLGAVGAVITGFQLKMDHMALVMCFCALAAAVSALCFCIKRGGIVLLCLLALAAGYLWHRGDPAEQLLALLYQVSARYDGAYSWGVLRLMDGDLGAYAVDYPMGVLGCLVAIAVSWTVCRRKRSYFACTAGLLPLGCCLVVTDTVPDTLYLFLLMFGLGVLILTASVRRTDAGQGNRLAALVALPVAAALGILFLAVPRENYVNQSKEFQEKLVRFVEELPQMVEQIPEMAESATQELVSGISGSSPRQERLDTLGPRITSRTPVMDVTVQKSGTLYLRGQDFDSYTGTGWTASRNRSEAFYGSGNVTGDMIISTRRKLDVLYQPYYPGDGITLTGGRLNNTEGLKEYELDWRTLPYNWKQTVEQGDTFYSDGSAYSDGSEVIVVAGVGSTTSTKDQWRYLNLPLDTKERAKQIVDSLLTDERSATDKADTIAAFVRNSALYDLDTGRMPRGEEDFALWFLEDSETGYCVHFATATVVLLRAAGIEARYVTGYMVQTKAGETVTVTGEEAHAWAEYFEPALQVWIPLESTPADLSQEDDADESDDSEETEESSSAEGTEPTAEPDSGPEETGEEDPLPTAGLPIVDGSEALEKPAIDLSWLEDVFRTIVLAVLVVLLLEGQRQTRLRLRRQRQRRGHPNARALACWQELALLSKLRREQPPREAEQLAQKAKFSQHTLTEEELAVFGEHLRICRRMLRQEAWYKRLVYQYIFAVW